MQLSLLSQSYAATSPVVGTAKTVETRTYLGKRHTSQPFNVTHRQPLSADWVYQGVAHSR